MNRHEPARVLVIKTGALGDVLRTTSILGGLARRHGPELHVTWVTAAEALPLLEGLVATGDVAEVLTLGADELAGDSDSLVDLGARLAAGGFTRVLSFDDEEPLCQLATQAAGGDLTRITGAYLDGEGDRRYTEDAAPWFDMGLLSVHGRERADALKLANRRSHPDLFAEVVGAPLEPGEGPDPTRLELPPEAVAAATARLPAFVAGGPLIGLNTGAGGRWTSKSLPEDRVVALALELDRRLEPRPRLALLGGPEEAERNARIRTALDGRVTLEDPGTDNDLATFGALVAGLDLLVTSDSLALHLAIATQRPVVAFFAPTSAAEIELYGRGEKVVSTAADACSYRRDADTSTLTVERLADAVGRVLAD